jgi:hypothetical protein
MSVQIFPATEDDLINSSIIENLRNDNYDLSFQNSLLVKENDKLKNINEKLIIQNNELKDIIQKLKSQNNELKNLNDIFPEKI